MQQIVEYFINKKKSYALFFAHLKTTIDQIDKKFQLANDIQYEQWMKEHSKQTSSFNQSLSKLSQNRYKIFENVIQFTCNYFKVSMKPFIEYLKDQQNSKFRINQQQKNIKVSVNHDNYTSNELLSNSSKIKTTTENIHKSAKCSTPQNISKTKVGHVKEYAKIYQLDGFKINQKKDSQQDSNKRQRSKVVQLVEKVPYENINNKISIQSQKFDKNLIGKNCLQRNIPKNILNIQDHYQFKQQKDKRYDIKQNQKYFNLSNQNSNFERVETLDYKIYQEAAQYLNKSTKKKQKFSSSRRGQQNTLYSSPVSAFKQRSQISSTNLNDFQ